MLTCVVLIAAFIIVFAQTGDSPETAALDFMSALATGDVATLTKLTYISGQTPEQIRKQWDFAENTAGKYYSFNYIISGSTQTDSNDAAISMQFTKDSRKIAAYSEPASIPMIKKDGKWFVDVGGMDRTLFPALPH
jgi:hypothetical protein